MVEESDWVEALAAAGPKEASREKREDFANAVISQLQEAYERGRFAENAFEIRKRFAAASESLRLSLMSFHDMVATDPAKVVLAVVKSNLAKKPESLTFQFVADSNGWPRVQWIGASPHSADALIAAGRDHEDTGQLGEAIQLLTEWLRNGPKLKLELLKSARDAGLAVRTLERAKTKMGVVHHRTGFGADSRTTWELPYSPTPPYTPINGEYGGGAR